ncbi:hypothetical protein DW904_19750 [Ruminococcus sp. AM42-11]|nr:hypothetical protein DW904_19750 [Ruminococcus sp. AM42-11]
MAIRNIKFKIRKCFYLDAKMAIRNIKFKIQKAYYRIFNHQKYLSFIEFEKNIQELFDILDDRKNYL